MMYMLKVFIKFLSWNLVYLSHRRIERLKSESSNDTQCDGANADAVSHGAATCLSRC